MDRLVQGKKRALAGHAGGPASGRTIWGRGPFRGFPERFPLKRSPAALRGARGVAPGTFGDDSRGLMASEGAETASESRSGASGGRSRGRLERLCGGRRQHVRRTSCGGMALGLATAVAVLGGLLLLYAETLDLYRIVTPSGSVSNAAGLGAHRLGPALLGARRDRRGGRRRGRARARDAPAPAGARGRDAGGDRARRSCCCRPARRHRLGRHHGPRGGRGGAGGRLLGRAGRGARDAAGAAVLASLLLRRRDARATRAAERRPEPALRRRCCRRSTRRR